MATPHTTRRSTALAAALAASLPLGLPLHASEIDAAGVRALIERLERLEARLGADAAAGDAAELADLQQRLAILERKIEIQNEELAAKAPTTPQVSINEKGLAVKTAKGEFGLSLRGTVQFDQRQFLGDDSPAFNDSFLFRRIRPSLEGNFGSLIAYRLTPEFAGDGTTIVDAYVDVRFDPRYTLRVGKLKGPVGLERLQSASAIALIERGFPTELAPNRDIGAQLQGDFYGGQLNYAFGVFNGTPDGRDAPTTDADDNPEFAARVFAEPWRNSATALSGLGFGIAASHGDKEGSGNNFLPRYRTPGQNVFFNYRGAVLADGVHRRLSPQAYWYRNRFGVLGEFIRSEQKLRVGTDARTRRSLEHEAWQLTASWVLTGEDASFRGVARPDRPFTVGGDGWGAFELVGRVGELDVDDAAFPLYADASAAATRSRAWGIGLNWYLSSNLKLVLNHSRARFDGGAPGGADREDEKTLFSRLQLAF